MALSIALRGLVSDGVIESDPMTDSVAAISVGIVSGTPLLDLCYEEDSAAETDMNVVMTGSGRFVELQATAEGAPFSREEVNDLLDLAETGIRYALERQAAVLQS